MNLSASTENLISLLLSSRKSGLQQKVACAKIRVCTQGLFLNILKIPPLLDSITIDFELLLTFQNLLASHDIVAQRDYVPKLSEVPVEVDEDEETIKIVQLVKSQDPLVSKMPLIIVPNY